MNDRERRHEYTRGRYLVVVKQPEKLVPASTLALTPALGFGAVRLEVDASRSGGSPSYGFGLVCRSRARSGGSSTYYSLLVTSTGQALISREGPKRVLKQQAFRRRLGRTNRLAATCAGEPAGLRLTLLLNGRKVAEAVDPRPLAATGGAGFLASSLERGGVRVSFDDFVVRKI